MTVPLGQQVLESHLHGMPTSAAIVLPNGPGGGLPRYVVQRSVGMVETFDTTGTTEAEPTISVNVETEPAEFAFENDALVTALCERFKPGTVIEYGGAKVTITKPPHVGAIPPRQDSMGSSSAVYTTPVIIRGWFTF
ncbi:hypothetical protein [Ponticoccus litoralis]|uniref:Uncharacterized protein n=1 Tax=Ponticoccus litoralis TaxID=422297 RepID=A0AAW9SG08_9RHOB